MARFGELGIKGSSTFLRGSCQTLPLDPALGLLNPWWSRIGDSYSYRHILITTEVYLPTSGQADIQPKALTYDFLCILALLFGLSFLNAKPTKTLLALPGH